MIEPVEFINDDETVTNNHGSGDMLVYYSLGNFVNWTSGTGAGVANRMVGGMAQVTIGIDAGSEAVIKDYGVEPVVCHVTSAPRGVTVYPLRDYSDDLGKENEIISGDPEFSAQYCRDLCAKVWGK